MRRVNTSIESLRAPGLPVFSRDMKELLKVPSRYLKVSSVNYDYLPMSIDSPKTLWIDLVSPAPNNLLTGTPVKLHLSPGKGIQTTYSKFSKENSLFEVTDIIGSRIILSPYKGSTWLPTVHSSCSYPLDWGYDMRRTNVSTSMRNNKYGYGVPISLLEYKPVYYSTRATQLEAARVLEDYYRGSRHLPGWH